MNMQTRAMGGFRALTNDEIMAVSGGANARDIVVRALSRVEPRVSSSGFGIAGGGGGGSGLYGVSVDTGDDDGDGIVNSEDEDQVIVVTANATHSQVQAANSLAELDLYTFGVFASPFVVFGGSQLTAGLTLGQQFALGVATAAVVDPVVDRVTDRVRESLFNQQLERIQNPGLFSRQFLPY